MQEKTPRALPFIGLILAAGYAKRMQSNKLLLPWQGKALVRHVIDNMIELELADIFTVLRHDADTALVDAVHDTKCIRTHNAHKGMGASLASGIQGLIDYMQEREIENTRETVEISIAKPTITKAIDNTIDTAITKAIDNTILGVIVFLGDMPAVHNDTVRELCKQALLYPTCPHAPVYDNRRGRRGQQGPVYDNGQGRQGQQGHPVIIPIHLWPALTKLDGEAGAKKLLREQGLRLMPTHDSNICMDIDTPSAYQALLNRSSSK